MIPLCTINFMALRRWADDGPILNAGLVAM